MSYYLNFRYFDIQIVNKIYFAARLKIEIRETEIVGHVLWLLTLDINCILLFLISSNLLAFTMQFCKCKTHTYSHRERKGICMCVCVCVCVCVCLPSTKTLRNHDSVRKHHCNLISLARQYFTISIYFVCSPLQREKFRSVQVRTFPDLEASWIYFLLFHIHQG